MIIDMRVGDLFNHPIYLIDDTGRCIKTTFGGIPNKIESDYITIVYD
jgi:hypothetical protein